MWRCCFIHVSRTLQVRKCCAKFENGGKRFFMTTQQLHIICLQQRLYLQPEYLCDDDITWTVLIEDRLSSDVKTFQIGAAYHCTVCVKSFGYSAHQKKQCCVWYFFFSVSHIAVTHPGWDSTIPYVARLYTNHISWGTINAAQQHRSRRAEQ